MVLIISGKEVLIDDEDYDKIKSYKWYAFKSGKSYRVSTMKPTIYIHRLILKYNGELDIDHIDGNALNNVKTNLRICSHCNNTKNVEVFKSNKSGYKGVCYAKWAKKWRAEIQHNKARIKIGYFDTPKEAAIAYNEYSLKYHGEYGRLNIIDE